MNGFTEALTINKEEVIYSNNMKYSSLNMRISNTEFSTSITALTKNTEYIRKILNR